MLKIYGDILEGGGQIVRTALALATLLRKEVHIINIRGCRKPPGLKAQHITGIKILAALSRAEVTGLKVGSKELYFKPKKILGGKYKFEVGTAGSISLVLQAIMPVAAFSPTLTELMISGGTDVKWSPTIDYLRMVVLPLINKMGYYVKLMIKKRGHYPKGGGELLMIVKPLKKLSCIQLIDRGEIIKIGGISHSVSLPINIAERQARSAANLLKQEGFKPVEIKIDKEHLSGLSPGTGITLYAESSKGCIVGADALGEKGKPAEKVGEEVAGKLLKELHSEMCLDRHMGDIIIPYMALADGKSEVSISRITLHTLTNIRLAEIVTEVKFNIKGKLNSPGIISVQGIGYNA